MTPPNEIYRLVKKQYMNTHRHSISRICATVRVHTWNTEKKKKKAACPAVVILGHSWIRSYLSRSLADKRAYDRQGGRGGE